MTKGKQEIVITEKKLKKDHKKKKLKKRVAKEISKIGKLDRINPYLLALVDPWSVHGVRVPDFTLDDSSTFWARTRRMISIGANGCGGMIFGTGASGAYPNISPFGGLVPYNTGQAITYSVGLILPSNCTTAALIPGTPTNYHIPNFASTSNTVPTNFSRVRLVSFGVRITFTGTAINAQGKITTGYAPFGTLTNKIANCTISLDDVLNLPHSTVTSVPLVGSACVTWRPTDFQDQNYCAVGPAAPASPSSGLNPQGCAPCEIYVFVDGAIANQTFFLEAIWNFEAIPVTSTLSFITSSPSKSDPIALSHAANRIAEIPATMSYPSTKLVEEEPKQDATLEHVQPHPQPSMFESLLNTGTDIAKGVGKAWETISPLAEMALSLL